MLLQTNSYIVPKDKRSEHARLLRKFRATLQRLGCDHFEVYEQVGANWAGGEATGRFVQIMRFRDRQHQQQIQQGEKTDPAAQRLIQEFCALINFPYQQQQGLFAVGFYTSAFPVAPPVPQRTPGRTASPLRQSDARESDNPGEQPDGGIAEVAVPAGAITLASQAADYDPSEADAEPPREAGSSLLDFANMSPEPAAEEPPPMRLTSEADDAIVDVETEIPPNGEHPTPFSDAPEAMLDLVNTGDDDVLTDEDREAVLGELTGDDASDPADDDDAQARQHAR